jgi:hypothetical protein
MKQRILFFLLAISFSSNAQVSGYLGKRFTAGYDNYFFVTFAGPTNNNSNRTTSSVISLLGINTVHCVNFEYVIKNRTAICFTLQHFKTGVDYRIHGHYDRAYYTGDMKQPASLNSNNIGVGFKFFRKGYVAPVGKYIKIEFLLLFYKLKYNKDSFELKQNNDFIKVPEGTGEYDFSNYSVSCTFGKQRILGNKIVLDYGIRIGLKPGFAFFYMQDGNEGNPTKGTWNYDAQYRVLRQQFFNFHLGLGFLVF